MNSRRVMTMPLAALGAAIFCAASHGAELKSVGSAYVAGNAIGTVAGGKNCSLAAQREWSELLNQRVATELPQAFDEQLKLAGTATAQTLRQLDVSAFLNDVNVRVCNTGHGAWQGRVAVQVSWKVSSPQTGRVIYQASTQGLVSGKPAQAGHSASNLREAFAVAARNLLADKRFVASLQQSGESSRYALLEQR